MTGFCLTKKRLQYSYAWAETIIDRLYAKHPRATELTLGLIKLSKAQLALILAQDRPEYYAIREHIKVLAKALEKVPDMVIDEDHSTAVKTFFWLLRLKLQGKSMQSFAEYLTTLENALLLKSQS